MSSFDAAIETYKSSNEELTSAEFNIFLEHKFNIIKYLIEILDDLQEEHKKDEEPLLIYCAKCIKKHFLGKGSLTGLKFCKICEDGHATEH